MRLLVGRKIPRRLLLALAVTGGQAWGIMVNHVHVAKSVPFWVTGYRRLVILTLLIYMRRTAGSSLKLDLRRMKNGTEGFDFRSEEWCFPPLRDAPNTVMLFRSPREHGESCFDLRVHHLISPRVPVHCRQCSPSSSTAPEAEEATNYRAPGSWTRQLDSPPGFRTMRPQEERYALTR